MAIKGTVVPSEAILMLKITIFMIIITMHQVSICFFKKKKNYLFCYTRSPLQHLGSLVVACRI